MTINKNIKSQSWKRLENQLPNAIELHKDGVINIIPLYENTKIPLKKDNTAVQFYYQNKQYPIDKLLKHEGNFGVIRGYSTEEDPDSWLCCIDIDGFKSDKRSGKPYDKELHDKSCNALFEVLSTIPNTITVKTASNGYHLYFMGSKEFPKDEICKKVLFNDEFPIEHLHGKPINRGSKKGSNESSTAIELFTGRKGFMVFTGSSINGNEYEIISENKDFRNLKVKSNIEDEIFQAFLNHGYKDNTEAYNKNRTKKKTIIHKSHIESPSIVSAKDPEITEDLIHYICNCYKQGQMDLFGYRLIGCLRLNNWKEDQVKELFKSLPIEHNLKKINSLIRRNYEIPLGRINGWKHLENWFLDNDVEEFENTFNFFKDLFDNELNPKYEIPLGKKFRSKKVFFDSEGIYFYIKKDLYLRISKPSSNEFGFIFCKVKEDEGTKEISNINLIGNDVRSKKPISIFDTERKKALLQIIKFGELDISSEALDKLIFELSTFIMNTEGFEILKDNPKDYTSIKEVSPLENLKQSPTSKKNQMDFSMELEGKYNIKKTEEDSYYYYKDESKTFSILTPSRLGVKIRKDYAVSFPNETVKGILSSIQREDTLNKNVWEFLNYMLDLKDFKIKEIPEEKVFTDKKIGLQNEEDNSEIELLSFDPEAKLHKNNDSEETYTEKILKMILVPKEDPEDTDLLIDFFQRLGASLLRYNKYKTITIYRGDRNNGKSILNLILKLIFNVNYIGITPDQLKDNFKLKMFSDTNSICFDELDKNSFLGFLPLIKRLSGGKIYQDERKQYDTINISSPYFGMLWVLTNVLPMIDLDEEAMFDRSDVLETPNTFLNNKEFKNAPNTYLIDPDVSDKLEKDLEGLSWLISMGIKEFKKMKENNETFKCKQSVEETISIYMKTDILSTFLIQYIEEDSTSIVSNKEIKASFEEYIKRKKINYNITSNTSKAIGNKLKEELPFKFKPTKINGSRSYKGLRLKSDKEVELEYKYIYEILDVNSEDQLKELEYMESDKKLVYNAIKDGYNTYNKIKEEYDNIRVKEILNELEDQLLIENTYNTSLS